MTLSMLMVSDNLHSVTAEVGDICGFYVAILQLFSMKKKKKKVEGLNINISTILSMLW